MLRKLRIIFAVAFLLGVTLLFLDGSGVVQPWLGWMAKLQFLPACLALNAAVIIGLVLLTLAFGRVYCSVICPLGVLQDGVARLGALTRGRAPYKYRKEKKWLRYGVFGLFIISLIAGVQAAVAVLAPYSAYGRMVSAVLHHNSVPVMIVAGVTLLVVGVLAFFGGRTYCNSICPVGTCLSFLSRFAAFRPVIDADKCRDCHICEHKCKAQCIDIANHRIDYSRCVDCFDCLGNCKFGALKYEYAWGGKEDTKSFQTPRTKTFSPEKKVEKVLSDSVNENSLSDKGRRAFITGTAIVAGTALLRAQEKKVDGGFAEVLPKAGPERETPLTPPGSRSVKDFYRRCTACQLCVSECPNGVLRPSASLERLMQPEMGFEKGFCRPECTRCSQLCPSGAIKPIGREEKTQYHVGTAHINLDACLSLKGVKCGNCATKCPTGAITMVESERGLTPVVAEQICIGCGACEYLCPVRPISAITVNGREEHIL